MPRQKGEPNKSQAIRDLLKTNRRMTVRKVIDTLAEKGMTIRPGLVYYVKGEMKGKKKKMAKGAAQKAAGATATSAPNSDALTTVLKVKKLAEEVGGLKKLRALVEALD
jgi:hypothetical protein